MWQSPLLFQVPQEHDTAFWTVALQIRIPQLVFDCVSNMCRSFDRNKLIDFFFFQNPSCKECLKINR
ncbi:hypothetical protein LPC_2188 [Legionella pneumophila str. Corby]|nr:hypothetical protein LPC_2188 [Legionella pneumophila str. Corby]